MKNKDNYDESISSFMYGNQNKKKFDINQNPNKTKFKIHFPQFFRSKSSTSPLQLSLDLAMLPYCGRSISD